MLSMLFWTLAFVVVSHHLLYPVILSALARLLPGKRKARDGDSGSRPTVTVIVPAYNEERLIAGKVADLAILQYPAGQLRIIIGCDGCTDRTVDFAAAAIAACNAGFSIELRAFPRNRGKVQILNDLIGEASSDIVLLTDVSARLEPDAVERLVAHFGDSAVGAVGAGYAIQRASNAGEAAYWHYQTRAKTLEDAVGAPMGLHGACYAFRRSAWTPLPAGVINDDFVLPMRLVSRGWRVDYDPSIRVEELEWTRPGQDWSRRRRIGAGNLQQAMICWRLADLRRPGVALVFLLGKGARAVMPAILCLLLAVNLGLAIDSWTYFQILVLHLAFYAIAAMGMLMASPPAIFAWPAYLVAGHAAALVGIVDYAYGRRARHEQAAAKGRVGDYVPIAVHVGKRTLDLILGSLALVVLALLTIPIAIAIRMESRGPIFYKQLRVGRAWPDRTDLFHVLKFRSMRVDAEQLTGAVLAGRADPRITRVGSFLRKCRLDELPQAINVLRGEMSIVGPRPERPVFFPKLEAAIPFYSERVFALKPGITGLAQVLQGYDETLDDVRNKVMFDHSYALRISSAAGWLQTDIAIICRTLLVMVMGKGR